MRLPESLLELEIDPAWRRCTYEYYSSTGGAIFGQEYRLIFVVKSKTGGVLCFRIGCQIRTVCPPLEFDCLRKANVLIRNQVPIGW